MEIQPKETFIVKIIKSFILSQLHAYNELW